MSALNKQVSGDHYKKLKIQPAEYIHANGIGFFEGEAISYVSRWKEKGGLNDVRKAIHILEMLIELEEIKEKNDAIPEQRQTIRSADHSEKYVIKDIKYGPFEFKPEWYGTMPSTSCCAERGEI